MAMFDLQHYPLNLCQLSMSNDVFVNLNSLVSFAVSQGYRCKSGIVIVILRFTWNYALLTVNIFQSDIEYGRTRLASALKWVEENKAAEAEEYRGRKNELKAEVKKIQEKIGHKEGEPLSPHKSNVLAWIFSVLLILNIFTSKCVLVVYKFDFIHF